MKQCFLGKIREKNDTRNFFRGHFFGFSVIFLPRESHKFSTSPQLSEYVQVIRRNTNGTCLKSVSKTPTFRFFRDFQPLNRLLHTSSQMANFGQFLGKMGKTGFFFKKEFGTFFSLLKTLINCKVSEKSNEGIQKKKCQNLHFLAFWAKMANFWTFFGQNGQNGNFFQKSAWNIFLALKSPN